MMKRIRIIFSMVLLLAVFASGAAAFETSVVPERDVESVYLISSAAELSWFRDKINEGETGLKGRLIEDIDLRGLIWIPIGNIRTNAYAGVFEGNGRTIRGLLVTGERTYAGLFGCIGDSGVVQDLMLEGAHVVAGSAADFTVGILAGTTSGVLQNCTVIRSSVTAEDLPGASGVLYAGAVAGYNDEGIILNTSSVQCEVRTRQSYASQRELAVGGIVGRNVGTLPGMGLLQNCDANDNKIVMEGRAQDSDASAGGILGLALGGVVRRCSNTGGSVENNYFMGSSAAVGGIIGFSPLGSYIEHCAVGANARLIAKGGAEPSSVGGIAGTLIGSNVDGSVVESVRIDGTGDLAHCLGGVIGTFAGGKISNCFVEQASFPDDPELPYRVGAVAGATFEVEIADSTPQTLIENTYYEERIAGGRPVGSDSNPENTHAIPFDKEHEPTYLIDTPSFDDDARD